MERVPAAAGLAVIVPVGVLMSWVAPLLADMMILIGVSVISYGLGRIDGRKAGK
jgi:hypothetical protein